MTDDRPTTDDIRDVYAMFGRRGEAGFDRWLAEHDREVAVKALEAAAEAHAQEHGKRYPSGLIMSTETSRFLSARAMLVRRGKVIWNG